MYKEILQLDRAPLLLIKWINDNVKDNGKAKYYEDRIRNNRPPNSGMILPKRGQFKDLSRIKALETIKEVCREIEWITK